MRRAEKHKPELVFEKLELPFSKGCLGKATAVAVEHKLVVADRLVVAEHIHAAERMLGDGHWLDLW